MELTPEELQAKIDDAVAKALANIKPKLDAAYERRDAAQAEADTLKAKLAAEEAAAAKLKSDTEAEKLAAEGKLRESYEVRMAGIQAERDAALKAQADLKLKNTQLTRDTVLRTALGGHQLRNENASNMAYNAIVGTLVEKDGQWVSADGKPISEAVSDYFKDEANSFLLVPAHNSGTGQTKAPVSTGGSGDKPLSQLTNAELLERFSPKPQ